MQINSFFGGGGGFGFVSYQYYYKVDWLSSACALACKKNPTTNHNYCATNQGWHRQRESWKWISNFERKEAKRNVNKSENSPGTTISAHLMWGCSMSGALCVLPEERKKNVVYRQNDVATYLHTQREARAGKPVSYLCQCEPYQLVSFDTHWNILFELPATLITTSLITLCQALFECDNKRRQLRRSKWSFEEVREREREKTNGLHTSSNHTFGGPNGSTTITTILATRSRTTDCILLGSAYEMGKYIVSVFSF